VGVEEEEEDASIRPTHVEKHMLCAMMTEGYKDRKSSTCVRALVFECCSFDSNILELVSDTLILVVFEAHD